jgi:hypothetical protein
MADLDTQDDLTRFEAKDTAHKIPVGWALLFWGLIVWGAYYLWAFTPGLGGWSQARDAEGGGAAAGTNMTATILFTVVPTAAAVALWIAFARKKKA